MVPECRPRGRTALLVAATIVVIVSCAAGEEQTIVVESPVPVAEPDTSTDGPFSIVTRDPLATVVGYQVLERGGTAADAAFAAGMAISVSEPHFSHALGGGTWALHYDEETGTVEAIDGVGTAGSLVDVEFFRDPERNTYLGMHRVIVPGGWDAWMVMLDRYGTMELDELMAPAIALARGGVPVSRSLASFIAQEQTHIRRHEATANVFLPGGRPPVVGERLYQLNLADTLEAIVAAYRAARPQGRSEAIAAASDYYYRGPIAKSIVDYSTEHGGFLILDDFAEFRARVTEPLSIRYGDLTVYSPPPNSQGIAMLIALRILDGYDFEGRRPDDPYVVHRVVEATKLAKIDTWHYVGDPAFVDVPVEQLLSDDHTMLQRGRIDPDGVIEWPTEGGIAYGTRDTTTFSIIDRYGNAVAVTTSIGSQFLIAGDTGINLNQRMANMETAEGNPNVIAPGKKVRHTVNPYLVLAGDRLHLLGGNTGFDTQPQGQIQQLLNIVTFGLTAQEAVSRPRYITHAFPSSTYPYEATNLLFLERGMPGSTIAELTRIGHTIGGAAVIGNGNVTVVDAATGAITLGADPRGENLGLVGPMR